MWVGVLLPQMWSLGLMCVLTFFKSGFRRCASYLKKDKSTALSDLKCPNQYHPPKPLGVSKEMCFLRELLGTSLSAMKLIKIN